MSTEDIVFGVCVAALFFIFACFFAANHYEKERRLEALEAGVDPLAVRCML